MQNQRKLKIYNYSRKDLKMRNDLVSLRSVDRLFHTLASLYENLFCPTVDFLKGSLKSEVVFLRLCSVKCEFLVNMLYIYFLLMSNCSLASLTLVTRVSYRRFVTVLPPIFTEPSKPSRAFRVFFSE